MTMQLPRYKTIKLKVCKQQEEEDKKEQGKEKMHLSTKVRKCTS
jgi:hypothetical protein